ncbi:MAG TPA: hypothetical protein VIK34_05720 [Clostridiaceae bacterium]
MYENEDIILGKLRKNSAQLAEIAAEKYKVYGCFWSKGSSPTLTRMQDARGAVANAGVDAVKAYNEFDLTPLFKDFTEVTDSYGNVFIRIPKMYIKKADASGYKPRQISRKPFAGAYLPECFKNQSTGLELDYVDVGKYVATTTDGTKLESKANAYPLINKNIVEFRTMAKANNIGAIKGYQIMDIHVMDLLQTLFLIEFATINSQSVVAGYTSGQYADTHLITVATTSTNTAIVANATAALYAVGQAISAGSTQGGNQRFYGRTITAIGVNDSGGAGNAVITFDGAVASLSINDRLYNTGMKTGFSAALSSSVGSPKSNSDGKKSFVYHGIESLYGDVWQVVDGLNINERQAWVCKNADNYASNVFAAPYEQLGYVNGSADGYATAMGYDANLPFCELPTAVGGATSTYYSDYYYQTTGQRVALVGGGWHYGSFAGLFFWPLSYASSDAAVNIGSRLLCKAL